MANAFERMGAGNKSLESVAVNTKQTAASVSVGGDLYKKMDELVKALKGGTGTGGGKVSIKEALVLRITAGALEPIGLGLGIIIDSLNRAPDGKELKLKMEALTNGLLALGDVGWAILKFAGMMILATPLLLVAGVAALIWVPMLRLMIDGLMWATKKLDKKGLKNIIALGEVGKALLILSASLVLMALLTPLILQGLLVAGVVLLGFGLMLMLLGKMGLDTKAISKFGKALGKLALALFGLSLTLILIGLLTMPILAGLATAALILLTIGGVFWLMDKMQVDKSMRTTSIALMFAAGAILSVAIALVLSHLILSSVGFEEVAKVMLIVGAIAAVFGVIGLAAKQIREGALSMIFAAGAILALTIAIYLMQLVLGDMSADDVINSFKVLAVIAGVGIVMAVAGLAAKQIKKGSIAMMVAALAMIVLAVGTYAMLYAVKDRSWEEIGMVGAIIAGAAVAFGIAGIGPIPMAIALGSAAMILAGVAMVVIGAGATVMMGAIKGATWEEIGMMGAVIAGVGIAMGVAGLASIPIALGSAAMILAGGAMYKIALGVQELNKLSIADMFADGGLFSDSGTVTKGFLGIGGGRPMTKMEVMFEAIANSFSLGPLQIAGMYKGAPALKEAGYALVSIGKGLQEFQKIAKATDLKALGVNVGLITTTLIDAFAKAGNMLPRPKTILGALLNAVSDQNPVSKGISSVSGMGNALTSIAMGMQQMANLRFPVAWDKNGKPIKFESMKSDAPQKVAANTKIIVDALVKVFADAGNLLPRPTSIMGALLNAVSDQHPVTKGISSVAGMGGALMGIAMGFQSMANLRFPTKWDKNGKPIQFTTVDNIEATAKLVNKNIKEIITGLTGTFQSIGKGEDSSWFGSTDYEKGVDVVTGLGTPLKNLAEGVINMANMKFPTGYDKDGKATGWINLSAMSVDDIKDKIGTNTQTLIEALTDVFVAIGGGKASTEGASWWGGSTTFEKGAEIVNGLGKPYKTLAGVVDDVLKITSKITSVDDVKAKVGVLIESITAIGGEDSNILKAKATLVATIGSTYAKLGTAIPLIIDSVARFTIDKAKAFASIFGGESDPSGFEAKSKFMNTLKFAYLRMALAIPLIVSSIGTVDAMQLNSFTAIYGGSMESGDISAKTTLFAAVGKSYEKIGNTAPKLTGAINSLDMAKAKEFRGLFVGKVSMIRPVAGYVAQTVLWKQIGKSVNVSGNSMPKVASAINAIDLTKLVESRKMFEALGVLSHGGSPGDVLAKMGESLEDALENLATMLNDFKDTVKEGNEEQGGIISKIGDTITKITGIGISGKKDSGSNSKPASSNSKQAAAAFPTTMTVTIDQRSIDKLTSGGFNFGSGE